MVGIRVRVRPFDMDSSEKRSLASGSILAKQKTRSVPSVLKPKKRLNKTKKGKKRQTKKAKQDPH